VKFSYCSRAIKYIKRHLFAFFYGNSFNEFGKRVSILSPDIIDGEKYISLEEGVSFNSELWILALKTEEAIPIIRVEYGATIGRFAHIVAIKEIIIEKNVLIADKVYISDNVHSYEDINVPIMAQEVAFVGSVRIGENSWIGENVSIIGAKIGKHCIVGANSVVNRDIPDYCVVVGVPAKIVKRYHPRSKVWKRTDDNGDFLSEI
jgi:acetyltransferase-like isoleucine patch superfamily enzyme